MKTTTPLGAVIVDEAKAIAIINYCLFGPLPAWPSKKTRPTMAKKKKRVARSPPPVPPPATEKCPLANVVLRKRDTPSAAPTTHVPYTRTSKKWRPREGLKFPAGLCYLIAMEEQNWPTTVSDLGYYPLVGTLLNSPHLVTEYCAMIEEQSPGLYHMVDRFSTRVTTLFLANRSWVVGAHLPGRPHPGHNAGYPQRPVPQQYPRPPPGPCPPLPPQSMIAPAVPLSVPKPSFKGKGKQKKTKAPFHPYAPPLSAKRPSSPAAQWKKALADPLEETMDALKAELDIFPSTLAIPAWKDTLAWLRDKRKDRDFDRKECIPMITEFFSTVMAKVKSEYTTIQEDERLQEETLTAESEKLMALLEQFKQVETALEHPTPGFDVEGARAWSKELADRIRDQEKVVDMLDGSTNPEETDMGDDPIADNTSFVKIAEEVPTPKAPRPLANELWPETNYQNYAARVADLYPAPEGKVPLENLLVKMEEPVDSKLHLPRPLELYTADELVKVVPKGLPRWNNRYEDPMEPAKCWTWEEFSQIYNEPGYHFMLARVAQVGPQCKDPKLSTLHSKLATQWWCAVTIQKMDPRQDWMLCTVPSGLEGEKDAMKYDLMRLSEGNVVYVIRRFAVAGRARDLEWTIRGSLADDNAIYFQMRKRLIEFEMGDTRLGWRVLGVRKAGATSKFRGTFILDSPATYWPWSMAWGHKHGSIPESSPLLNFEPTWSAKRPYACQCCYSMDHFTEECPLPFMKIGGSSLVSQPARTLVIKKKATERIISLEKSTWELPVPNPPGTPKIPNSPSRSPAVPRLPMRVAPMSIIEEGGSSVAADEASSVRSEARMSIAAPLPMDDPPYHLIDSLVRFLMLQLTGDALVGVGLTESKIQFLCKSHKGSMDAVLDSLRRDGWLPASVSNHVMTMEFERFIAGTPPPQPSGWWPLSQQIMNCPY